MTERELMEIVNPVSETAKACLMICAGLGDADAKKLMTKIDVTKQMSSENNGIDEELGRMLRVGFSSCTEVRYKATHIIFEATGIKNFMDIPCGYTPRAFMMARNGVNYIGCDLPAVITEMNPAVNELMDENEKKLVHYCEVDATNGKSMEEAASKAEGEVFITTEGLLLYFTESELENYLENIRRTLLKNGGCYVTTDLGFVKDFTPKVLFAALGKEKAAVLKDFLVGGGLSGFTNSSTYDNSLFKLDSEGQDAYLREHGFNVEYISLADYMPDLVSLKALPEENREAVYELYRQLKVVKLTAIEGEVSEVIDGEFKVESEKLGEALNLKLTGRLDTITAPSLLKVWEDNKETAKKVVIDAANLQYVSSAGLRVFLIIFKATNNNFKLVNYNDEVKEILETTGFYSMFEEN